MIELRRAIRDGQYSLSLKNPPRRLRRVTIEVTTWCNLRCSGCLRTIGVDAGTWRNKHMALKTFESIVEHLPPSELGVLHGIGEPTFHPHYLDMVTFAARSGKFDRLHCNTNALARDVDFYSRIVDAGINSFSVSVDSLTPDVAEATRSGTDTARLLERIIAFQKRGLPFNVQMVVSKLNREDIFLTLQTLNEHGPISVGIQPYINHDDRFVALDREEALQFLANLRSAKGTFERLQITNGGFRHLGIGDTQSKLPLCTAPWLDPGITIEGYLTPCCVEWNPEILGNTSIAKTPFVDAWNSATFQQFLASYIEQSPQFCVGCSENVREAGRGCDSSDFSSHEVVASFSRPWSASTLAKRFLKSLRQKVARR